MKKDEKSKKDANRPSQRMQLLQDRAVNHKIFIDLK